MFKQFNTFIKNNKKSENTSETNPIVVGEIGFTSIQVSLFFVIKICIIKN